MEAMMQTSSKVAAHGDFEPATEVALRYFECLPKPTLLLRPDGAIARANAAARALLLERHCLRIAYGRVVGYAGQSSEPFEETKARCLSGRVSRVVITMFVGGTQMWQLELTPMRVDSAAHPDDVLLMATLHPPVRPERGIVALARIFGLTCAETRVLAHLAEDRTPSEIGMTLGVSVTTVRTHLQSLFQKTGARRQPELVRLAWLASSS